MEKTWSSQQMLQEFTDICMQQNKHLSLSTPCSKINLTWIIEGPLCNCVTTNFVWYRGESFKCLHLLVFMVKLTLTWLFFS